MVNRVVSAARPQPRSALIRLDALLRTRHIKVEGDEQLIAGVTIPAARQAVFLGAKNFRIGEGLSFHAITDIFTDEVKFNRCVARRDGIVEIKRPLRPDEIISKLSDEFPGYPLAAVHFLLESQRLLPPGSLNEIVRANIGQIASIFSRDEDKSRWGLFDEVIR